MNGSSKRRPPIVNCPSCGARVEWSDASPYRPFCSLRCKQTDFCAWANEDHVVSGDAETADYFSESEQRD